MSIGISVAVSQESKNSIKIKLSNSLNEPLPYASIVFQGTNKGTISNEEGFFLLDTLHLYSDYLIITHLGFLTKIISVEEAIKSQLIDMEVAEYSLHELEIIDDKGAYALALLKKLIKKYNKLKEPDTSKVFLSFTSHNQNPLEVFEAFYTGRTSPKEGLIELTLKNGRAGLSMEEGFAFSSLNTTDVIKNFVPFKKNTYQDLPLSPTNVGIHQIKGLFKLNIEQIFSNQKDKTVVISFIPKYDHGKLFSGKIYLNPEKMTLYRLTFDIKNTSKKYLKSIQKDNVLDSLDIHLELNYQHKTHKLESIIYDYSFVLTNNNSPRIYTNAFFVFYDYQHPFAPNISEPLYLKFDYQRILVSPFSQEFWNHNYHIPTSTKKQNFNAYFEKYGYLINHDEISSQSSYLQAPYIVWNKEKRINWEQIPDKRPIITQETHSAKVIMHQSSHQDLNIEALIFLDYELYADKIEYFSRALFDHKNSYYLPQTYSSNPFPLLYINYYFDLYEIHRLILLEKLQAKPIRTHQEIMQIYQDELAILKNELLRLKNETKSGYNLLKDAEWNNYIQDELGVNNIKYFNLNPTLFSE